MLATAFLSLIVPSHSPVVDPAALALLKHCAGATLALRTYRAECRTTVTRDDPKAVSEFSLATLSAAKPNKMRYEGWNLDERAAQAWTKPLGPPRYVFACAGDVWHQQFGNILREDNRPAPDNLTTLLEPWGGFYDLKDSAYGRAMESQGRGELREASLQGVERVSGVRCRRVRLTVEGDYNGQTSRREETWSFGPDGLARRLLTLSRFAGEAASRRDAILVAVCPNVAIPEATYAYVPPRGIKRYADLEPPSFLAPGSAAPDFAATGADGRAFRLSELRNKVVVLDFWASWCAPCMASMPQNQAVVKRLQGQGVPVAFLALDDAESRNAFLRIARRAPKAYPNLRFLHANPGTVSGPYRVSSMPVRYVLGADGTVRSVRSGYGGPTDDLEREVRAALAAVR